MKISAWLKVVLVTLVGSFLGTGCVVRERVVYRHSPPGTTVVTQSPAGQELIVTEAPPAPVTEVITIAPGPGMVWVGGVWSWRGRWVWERGHWIHPPRVGVVWVPHRYVYRNGVHVWVRGGWR